MQQPLSFRQFCSAYGLCIGTLLVATILGYCIGRILATKTVYASAPMQMIRDTRPLVPTIVLQGVRNGVLHGHIVGSGGRLFIGDAHVVPTATGAFRAPAFPALINQVVVRVPQGMQFVASARGTKYYPVLSKSGERIAPDNRVYFGTEKEAEVAGYRP